MGTKVRKQTYIEPEQEALLKRLASESGMSESEIIREAIARHTGYAMRPAHSVEAWRRIKAFIGKRMEAGSIQPGRSWGREDLYDD